MSALINSLKSRPWVAIAALAVFACVILALVPSWAYPRLAQDPILTPPSHVAQLSGCNTGYEPVDLIADQAHPVTVECVSRAHFVRLSNQANKQVSAILAKGEAMVSKWAATKNLALGEDSFKSYLCAEHELNAGDWYVAHQLRLVQPGVIREVNWNGKRYLVSVAARSPVDTFEWVCGKEAGLG